MCLHYLFTFILKSPNGDWPITYTFFYVYLSPKINNFLLGPVHLTFSTNFEIQLIKKEDFCLSITKHEAFDEEFYSSTIKIRV